jgi:hypothetical protein
MNEVGGQQKRRLVLDAAGFTAVTLNEDSYEKAVMTRQL